MIHTSLVISILLVMMTACSTSNFSSDSSKTTPKPDPEQTAGSKGDSLDDQKGTDNSKANSKGDRSGKSGNSADGNNDDRNNEGNSNKDSANNSRDQNEDKGSSQGGDAEGEFGIEKNKNDDGFTIGRDVRFHIGDGEWHVELNQGCDDQLKIHDISGKAFIFPFEVESDDTEVSFDIGFICGITNFFQIENIAELVKGSEDIWDRPVILQNANNRLPSATLDKGRYELRFKSGQVPLTADYDDYVIGDIEVHSNKKITPLPPTTR